jgi:hypothetical protein
MAVDTTQIVVEYARPPVNPNLGMRSTQIVIEYAKNNIITGVILVPVNMTGGFNS